MGQDGLTFEERAALNRYNRRAQLPSLNADRVAEANQASTILGYERTIQGWSVDYVARRSLISLERYVQFENGTMAPRPGEAAGLERIFKEKADVLLATNDAEARAKRKPVI